MRDFEIKLSRFLFVDWEKSLFMDLTMAVEHIATILFILLAERLFWGKVDLLSYRQLSLIMSFVFAIYMWWFYTRKLELTPRVTFKIFILVPIIVSTVKLYFS